MGIPLSLLATSHPHFGDLYPAYAAIENCPWVLYPWVLERVDFVDRALRTDTRPITNRLIPSGDLDTLGPTPSWHRSTSAPSFLGSNPLSSETGFLQFQQAA